MKPRDIYLADFSKTDSDDDKIRPVLIVSSDEFNRGEDVVVLPISHSADPSNPFVFTLNSSSPEYRLTGLKKDPSSIKWTKPLTIPKRLLVGKLGSVSKDTFDRVRELTRSVFDYKART